ADLLVDLIYLPRGSDQLRPAHRRSPFNRLMKVPADVPEGLIEGEARILRTFTRVRPSGIVDVTVTVLLTARIEDRPDVEETTVVTVAVDPSEEEQVV
ncbi:MAG TPA: hypothetical protein DGR79_03545, partial [Clostridiales bacterium]|nr:hypothetical protein [Clostridiales bacterium]